MPVVATAGQEFEIGFAARDEYNNLIDDPKALDKLTVETAADDPFTWTRRDGEGSTKASTSSSSDGSNRSNSRRNSIGVRRGVGAGAGGGGGGDGGGTLQVCFYKPGLQTLIVRLGGELVTGGAIQVLVLSNDGAAQVQENALSDAPLYFEAVVLAFPETVLAEEFESRLLSDNAGASTDAGIGGGSATSATNASTTTAADAAWRELVHAAEIEPSFSAKRIVHVKLTQQRVAVYARHYISHRHFVASNHDRGNASWFGSVACTLLAYCMLTIVCARINARNANLTSQARVPQGAIDWDVHRIRAAKDFLCTVAWLRFLQPFSTEGQFIVDSRRL